MNCLKLLQAIQADERYRQNLEWGEPRNGHPEGTIRAHIQELEDNLEELQPLLLDGEAEQLRILIHVHDSFKPAAQPGVAITHDQSHASLARSFLAEFCSNTDLLNMVQFHDEPYALWRQHYFRGQVNQDRLRNLLSTIENWDLFHLFLIIDGCTAGKSREPLSWWFEQTKSAIESQISSSHLLPLNVVSGRSKI